MIADAIIFTQVIFKCWSIHNDRIHDLPCNGPVLNTTNRTLNATNANSVLMSNEATDIFNVVFNTKIYKCITNTMYFFTSTCISEKYKHWFHKWLEFVFYKSTCTYPENCPQLPVFIRPTNKRTNTAFKAISPLFINFSEMILSSKNHRRSCNSRNRLIDQVQFLMLEYISAC